jgi:hypothetical protein
MKNLQSNIFEQKWFVPLIILLVAFVAHGLLLISDFVITDGWWILEFLKENNWDKIKYLSQQNGLYFQRYYYGIYLIFPDPNVAIKVMTFVNLCLISYVTFLIFKKTDCFSDEESLIIAITSLTLPTVRVLGNAIPVMMYLSCYLIFLFCAYLAICAETKNGSMHVVLRGIAVIGFFVSFSCGSLLVFYYGFLIGLVLYENKRKQRAVLSFPWGWLCRRIDYISIPVIFWLWRITFTPGIGAAGKSYQQPSLSNLLEAPLQFGRLLIFTIPEEVFGGVRLLFTITKAGALAVCLSYVIARFIYRYLPLKNETVNKVDTLPLFFYGALLLSVAVLPYFVAGYYPAADWFSSRHALLMAIPVSILLLVGFRAIFYDSGGRFPHLLLSIFMIMSFSAVDAKTYLEWQAISVKEQSVSHNLSKIKGIEDYRLIRVQDESFLNTCYEQTWGRWSYVLRMVCGDHERYAYNASKYPDKQSIVRHVLVGALMPPYRSPHKTESILNGKQGIMTIQAGSYFKTNLVLVNEADGQALFELSKIGMKKKYSMLFTYFYYKIFKPEYMNEFLGGITKVQIRPVNDLLN